jgi:hypothetical protein
MSKAKATAPAGVKKGHVLAWEDDPETIGASKPIERPIPDIKKDRLAFKFEGKAIKPGSYPVKTEEFRYWVAARHRVGGGVSSLAGKRRALSRSASFNEVGRRCLRKRSAKASSASACTLVPRSLASKSSASQISGVNSISLRLAWLLRAGENMLQHSRFVAVSSR